MSAIASILQEFDNECATTRRVLERVPADRLTWKPHPKSMSLGQLALHVAQVPGHISEWALQDTYTFAGGSGAPEAASVAEILTAHDDSVKKTKDAAATIGDAGMSTMWQMQLPDGTALMKMPKSALIRSVALNHWYHHRGQLSVYLRLLDIPVPSIYGPSADEQPGGART